jgi:uncharacterized protein (DUF58 family)
VSGTGPDSTAGRLAGRVRRLAARIALPTGRAFVIALGLCALALVSLQVALAGLVALVGAIWADARAARREPALELEGDLPRRIGQGSRRSLTLRLFDPGPRARPHRLGLEADPSLFEEDAFVTRVAMSRPRRALEHRFAIQARRRGLRSITALHLRLRGPLGLAWVRERIAVSHTVLVVPGLREVLAHQSRAAIHLRRGAGRRRSRLRGQGGSFESLREYMRGDEPRHLDWKATARRAQPMVRQYETERSQNVLLALDCGRLMAERFDDRERLDHALAAAVVLARVAETWRDNVGLFAFADTVSHVLPPGGFGASRLIDELAALEARSVEPDYPRAFAALGRALRRRSLIVVFTDLVDGEVSEPLAANLGLLARRHLPLLVALRNPSLFAEAALAPEDSDQAYRRAAAAELIGEREKSLERLRRAGVEVVDIDPHQSVAAAVDAYVRIKLRGRI